MPLYVLDKTLQFPPVNEALEDGLLAMGGDIEPERLLLAYQQGIFPWYEGDIPLWWSPDPRFVLVPHEINISKSMQQLFRKKAFKVTINKSFVEVMRNCSKISRTGQDGTWINEQMINAYTQLHQQGYAISVECWQKDTLVGGLYGIQIGAVFCGESMFSKVSNASKYAFIHFVQTNQNRIRLIDCQVHTPHLESLGARMINRADFLSILHTSVKPGLS